MKYLLLLSLIACCPNKSTKIETTSIKIDKVYEEPEPKFRMSERVIFIHPKWNFYTKVCKNSGTIERFWQEENDIFYVIRVDKASPTCPHRTVSILEKNVKLAVKQ